MMSFLAALILLAGQDGGAPASAAQAGRAPLSPMEAATARLLFDQVAPHWNVACDTPGFADQRVVIDVALTPEGGLAQVPTAVNPDRNPIGLAAADAARRAVVDAAPFEVPEGFPGGRYRLVFRADRVCALARSDQP